MSALTWNSDLFLYHFSDEQAVDERVLAVWLVDYDLLAGYSHVRITATMRYRTIGETEPVAAHLRFRHGGTTVHHFGQAMTGDAADGGVLDDLVLGGAFMGSWWDYPDMPPAVFPGSHSFSVDIPNPGAVVEQLTATVSGIASIGAEDQALEIVGLSFTVQGVEVVQAYVIPPARIAAEQDIFGVDFDVLSDLPVTFRLARGLRNLANALLRRLGTPAGFLAEAFDGDRDYGYDVRGRLNSAFSTRQLAAVEASVADQCRLDERVLRATVRARHSLATKTLDLAIFLETPAGPFRMILRVSDVNIELLRAE